MCFDIVEIWIVDGQILSIFDRVNCLSHNSGKVLYFHNFISTLLNTHFNMLVQGMYASVRNHVRDVRGTVKSLKSRSVFTKARYSARCSSSLCLKPCHASSTLGSPGRTSIQ